MSPAKLPVTAAVVAYHSAATLPRCLQHLRASGVSQVVIVNNSPAEPIRVTGSEITVIPSPRNIGFAAACNQGAQRAVHPTLLFINPDAYVSAGGVAHALKLLQRPGKIGVVGLALQNSAGVPEADSWGEDVSLLSLFRRRLVAAPLPSRPRECGWVSGGAMLVRREAFRAVGGFDPAFFLYWEDVDVCRRIREDGWRVMLDPGAIVVHERGASRPDRSRQTRHYDAAADRYFRKHYAAMIWLLARGLRRLYRYLVPQVR